MLAWPDAGRPIMSKEIVLLVVSDIHYASDQEKARGEFELAAIRQPLPWLATKLFRHFIWLRHPLRHNPLLDQFLVQAGAPDWVVANGDYSCDSGFVGVSDEATCASVRICLGKLRDRFGARFHANYGDHELGKRSLFGGRGWLRLASWHRAQTELGLRPFWQEELGNYVLMNVVSSLVALPVFRAEVLPEELPVWEQLRAEHIEAVRQALVRLRPSQRVILFCHDPTALPFLWEEEVIRKQVAQVEHTIIGHLHSNLVLWKSRMLAGMPVIRFLGNSVRRMSMALHEARAWKLFKVRLCPALAGIELLKDGGFLRVILDPAARCPARFYSQPIHRR
jgi:hypothetical protein